ncbi:enoyl-CoA hydratase-related protein [Desulfosporosinus sp. PR]|uniref:enoyl-CoA hydratase/isomerase family protein n=1 Tax=Candidatus Desulfosporosinus nitrosoreducens TaxID=3401928 RepID=UPI0027E99AE6|nr:enoyl-CoA hydratase-related protein [Desulfosporosinus sp. PR]MDQ7096530.1 enoyl-CoA hydratase-related protein [Desulfosporosinus sp. PR]
MDYQFILYEKSEGIATITINRPELRNALTQALMAELGEAIDQADLDEEVKVLILTGAGDRSFVAGADINEVGARNTLSELGPNSRLRRAVLSGLEHLSKPSIAAVNGYALGGGCELALACTLRIAADSARFGQPEINLGIIPGLGGTQRLARLIGKGRTMEMVLLGELIDAQEAFRIGLVNRVVPVAHLLEEARALAKKLAAKPPLALRAAKDAVDYGTDMSLETALEFENRLFAIVSGSADKAEGVAAFLEKRKPEWRGR